MMKFKKYCICGASLKGTVPDFISKILLQEWEKYHSGEGHKPCNAQKASKARNRNDNPVFYR